MIFFTLSLLHKISPTNITRMLIYPSVWKENGVVAPIIEVKVLDQVREESHFEVAKGNEKRHWTLRLLIDYFELPKKQGNVGDEIDVCISPIDSKSMPISLNAKN